MLQTYITFSTFADIFLIFLCSSLQMFGNFEVTTIIHQSFLVHNHCHNILIWNDHFWVVNCEHKAVLLNIYFYIFPFICISPSHIIQVSELALWFMKLVLLVMTGLLTFQSRHLQCEVTGSSNMFSASGLLKSIWRRFCYKYFTSFSLSI